MLTPDKREIFDWFKEVSSRLSPKHFIKAARVKRLEYNDPTLLKYFDLLLFTTTSKHYEVRNPIYNKNKNKVSNKRKFNPNRSSVEDKRKYSQWIKIIPTPMGGQNKR